MKNISNKKILNKIENIEFSKRGKQFSLVRNALQGVFKKFVKFTGKQLFRSLFYSDAGFQLHACIFIKEKVLAQGVFL